MSHVLLSLFAAIAEDNRPRVKSLIAREPDLSRSAVVESSRHVSSVAHWIYGGDTALHVAAAGYRVEIAEMLLAAGAEVNAAGSRRRSRPLHYAADGHRDSPAWNERRQVAMLRLLLEAGGLIDAPDRNGATPLHRAVRTRCAAAVQFLLEADADPTAKNKPGSTPFHLAVQSTGRGGSGTEEARSAQRQIIAAFLRRGVRPTLADAKGKSVREWARSDWIRQMLSAREL